MRKGCDHVNITPDRDTLARGTPSGPWTGSETSWRNALQNTVTIQVLGAVLLVCLGLLLGPSRPYSPSFAGRPRSVGS
jgi:hypothetical protein